MDSVSKKVKSDFRSGKQSGKYTDAMKRLYSYLKKENTCKAAVINADSFQKEIVEALLISEASAEDIKSAFGIPEEVIADYKELYFDTTKLETHLDKLSYVTNYPDRFGKELKVRALNLGPSFIYFKYANIVPQTPVQRELVKKMFLSSAYRAMEANYTSMTSDISKASIEYAKVMLKAYDSIEKLMKEDIPTEMSATRVLLIKDRELKQVLELLEEDII